jgi:hypothetical protein
LIRSRLSDTKKRPDLVQQTQPQGCTNEDERPSDGRDQQVVAPRCHKVKRLILRATANAKIGDGMEAWGKGV